MNINRIKKNIKKVEEIVENIDAQDIINRMEIDKENSKAKVNIDLFGQETAVEVDLTQIEHDN